MHRSSPIYASSHTVAHTLLADWHLGTARVIYNVRDEIKWLRHGMFHYYYYYLRKIRYECAMQIGDWKGTNERNMEKQIK